MILVQIPCGIIVLVEKNEDVSWKSEQSQLALKEIRLNPFVKGQLISKCLFGVINSFKKRT